MKHIKFKINPLDDGNNQWLFKEDIIDLLKQIRPFVKKWYLRWAISIIIKNLENEEQSL